MPVAFAPPTLDPPYSAADRFALGPDGSVVMTMAPGSDRLLGIYDSSGTLQISLGRGGEGPGELRVPNPVLLDANGLMVTDMAQARIITFDPQSGKLLATTTITQPITILGAAGDRLLMAIPMADGLTLPAWGRPGLEVPSPLVAPSDSFVVAHFPPAPETRLTPLAVLGAWRGGVIVANGRSYAVGLYDSTGRFVRALSREVEPRFATPEMIGAFRRRAERYRGPDGKERDPVRINDDVAAYREKPQPHFSHVSPVREDPRGRIWIVGMEGDSAFADLFTPTGQIGHLGIACPGFSGRWSLNGEWLALMCAAPNGSSRDAVLQLFRIVESDTRQ
jgi:hypothetical protein